MPEGELGGGFPGSIWLPSGGAGTTSTALESERLGLRDLLDVLGVSGTSVCNSGFADGQTGRTLKLSL